MGIAPPIHALMVVPDGVDDPSAEDALQPERSHLRMAAHELPLCKAERGRLRNNLVRNPELADVVEEAGEARGGPFLRGQPDVPS